MTDIDAALVRTLLREQFPNLDATKVEYLNEGCDSVAFEIDERLVFRFPKRADVEAQMTTEREVLSVLASAGPPIAIPVIRYEGQPAGAFPFRFAGYDKLQGQSANRVALSQEQLLEIASVLGHFLSWLHDVPEEAVAQAHLETQDIDAVLDEVKKEALEDLFTVANVAPPASIDSWRSWIEETDLEDGDREPAVLVHNDFAAEHVLVDESALRLTGVIDWSDVAICDRLSDFAGIYHWGGREFANAVLDAYGHPLSPGQHRRARFLAASRGVLDVSFGLEFARPEYIEMGLRALKLNASA